MYDPEKSLEAERASKKSWEVYQNMVDEIGEDNDYCKWIKTINHACDTLSIEECYDLEKKQELLEKFNELSDLVEYSIKSTQVKF